MINNTNDIQEYKNQNKMYIPNNYLNSNYTYKINGDYITIITNQNCIQQYNTTYCNCYYYNYKNNVISDIYTCSTNNNNPTIKYNDLTDDINFSDVIRDRFIQDKGIVLVMIILGVLFAIFLTKERKSI